MSDVKYIELTKRCSWSAHSNILKGAHRSTLPVTEDGPSSNELLASSKQLTALEGLTGSQRKRIPM